MVAVFQNPFTWQQIVCHVHTSASPMKKRSQIITNNIVKQMLQLFNCDALIGMGHTHTQLMQLQPQEVYSTTSRSSCRLQTNTPGSSTLNQIQCTASHVRIETIHRMCHQTPHLLGLGRRLFGFLHLELRHHLHRGTTGLVSSFGFLGHLGVLRLLGVDLGLAFARLLGHCFGFWTPLFLGCWHFAVPPVFLGGRRRLLGRSENKRQEIAERAFSLQKYAGLPFKANVKKSNPCVCVCVGAFDETNIHK